MIERALILILVAGTAGLAQNTRDPFAEIHGRLLEAAQAQIEQIPVVGRPVGAVYDRPLFLESTKDARSQTSQTAPAVGADGREAQARQRAASRREAQARQRAASRVVGSSTKTIPIDQLQSPGFRRLAVLHPFMAPIFREEGVPHELLLVGLIESGYRNDAISPAQAVGMWQFIPSTARRFGLLDDRGDYRTDFERSTRAAARYLRFLLDKFSDWRLALAAYNAGEDRVERAIELGETRDFSELSERRLLPEETRHYVPSVLRAIAEARNLGVLR